MPALKQQDMPPKMTGAEFDIWYETQEGRWELHDGVPVRLHDPVKMQSERIEHARLKSEIYLALRAAVAKKNRKCEVLPDGMQVEASDTVRYEPDALVYCGAPLPNGTLIIPNPVIIVEVLSPSTAWKDVSTKLEDYFKIPSVAHYLILDPTLERIQHHYRQEGKVVVQEVLGKTLCLTPPDITLELESLFG